MTGAWENQEHSGSGLIWHVIYNRSVLVCVSATEIAAASFSFSSMSSRSAYTAITPEYANFPTHNPIPSGLNPSSPTLQYEEHGASSLSVEEEGSIPSRIHNWLASAKDFVQRNTGLLLFIASQVFLSFMNLAAKILNTIDPPIAALEVCLLPYLLNSLIWWYLAHSRSNGTQEISLSISFVSWTLKWIYPDNHLCLLRNIYVINYASLISCFPKLIYYLFFI